MVTVGFVYSTNLSDYIGRCDQIQFLKEAVRCRTFQHWNMGSDIESNVKLTLKIHIFGHNSREGIIIFEKEIKIVDFF